MEFGSEVVPNDQPLEANMSLRRHVENLESRIAELEALVTKLASSAGDGVSVKSNISPKSDSKPYTLRPVNDSDKIESGVTRELEITDESLIHLLGDAIGTYPGVNFDSGLVVIPSPFSAIVHNWDRLLEQVNKSPDMPSCKDLADLLTIVESTLELEGYFKLHETSSSSRIVAFETLWLLFAPKTLIVVKSFMDVPQILQVANSAKISQRLFQILAWHWDWDEDSKAIIPVQYGLEIERFQGRKDITELPYIPLSYWSNPAALCNKVRGRSLKFIKATARRESGAGKMLQYDGYALAHSSRIFLRSHQAENDNRITQSKTDDKDSTTRLITIRGDIICDAQAFLRYCSTSPPLGVLRGRRQMTDHQSSLDDPFEFEQAIMMLNLNNGLDDKNKNFLLLPPRFLGYATKEKVWAQFNVESIKPRRGEQSENFRSVLQLDEDHKMLIKALVWSYEWSPEGKFTDVVQDKGKGLALLLHGPPGVGKTLTAETIAESLGRPLLVVGVGDIGLDPAEAESNFEKIYSLALNWEAILLFDEADIFLEARQEGNTSQNALVSVLLRVLEYYRGIIILTTNRVAIIDYAILSRINLCVRYDELSSEKKLTIFRYLLDKLDPSLIHDRSAINTYIGQVVRTKPVRSLDGREIRNIVFAAAALAHYQRENDPENDRGLAIEHFDVVMNIAQDFKDQFQRITKAQRVKGEV